MPTKFPLYLHAAGQWCKTINGRKVYFGKDKAAALKRYNAEKDQLHRRPVRQARGSTTLSELGNVYADYLRKRVEQGKLKERSRIESIKTIRKLIDLLGKDDLPAEWTAFDFDTIVEHLYKPVPRTTEIRGGIRGIQVERRSRTTVDGDIRRIKAFLNWCAADGRELIPRPKYGESMKQMSAAENRQVKQSRQSKKSSRRKVLVTPEEMRTIVDACSVWFRPIVLLGINAGMSNSDAGQMRADHIKGEWLVYPRRKTNVEREAWLWPETRAAIKEFQKVRQQPFGKAYVDVLFHTKYREPWHRDNGEQRHDAVTKAFSKLADSLDLGIRFYDLRRQFQTIGEETGDVVATKYVMGHSPATSDMSAGYRESVSDERINRVCEHVRDWYLGGNAGGR